MKRGKVDSAGITGYLTGIVLSSLSEVWEQVSVCMSE